MIDRDRSQSLQIPPRTPQLTRHKIKRFIRRAKRRRETLLPLHHLKSDVASYRRLAHWGGTSHKPDRPVSFWLMRSAVANDNRNILGLEPDTKTKQKQRKERQEKRQRNTRSQQRYGGQQHKPATAAQQGKIVRPFSRRTRGQGSTLRSWFVRHRDTDHFGPPYVSMTKVECESLR